LGAVFLIRGLLDLIGALASRRWDPVSGEITESRMWVRRPSNWAVEIRYRYTIGGLTYEGDRFGFGKLTLSSFVTQSEAERAVSMYPKGRIVTVLVSPSDRSSAVIEPGIGRAAVIMCIAGAVLATGGLAAIVR
jgi:uncharacterized protein DUF3592